MTTTSSTTDTTHPLIGYGGLAVLVGIVAFIVSVPSDSDTARIIAIAALLGGLVLAGLGALMDRGAAGAPAAAPAAGAPARPVGLAGSRIQVGGDTFTVLDDSAAVNAAGRRASVVARDEQGRAGLLFLGFGSDGAVAEARIDGGDWVPATLLD